MKTKLDSVLSGFIQSGNSFTIDMDENGINIFISSYNDLIERVTLEIGQTILNANISLSNFNNLLEKTQEQIESFINLQPYEKAMLIFTKIIKNNITIYSDMLELITNKTVIRYTDFENFYKTKLTSELDIITQFYGSLEESRLNNITILLRNLTNNFALNTTLYSIETTLNNIHSHRILNSSLTYDYINDLSMEKNYAIVNFYQIGQRDIKQSLISSLIQMSWGNLPFYILRTEHQLGYIVFAQKYLKDNYMYYIFLVQGSKERPNLMDVDIDNVISIIKTNIYNLTEVTLNEYKEIVKEELNKNDANLKERSNKMWNEIYEGSYDFERNKALLRDIDGINKDDLIEQFKRVFTQDRKISIRISLNLTDAIGH